MPADVLSTLKRNNKLQFQAVKMLLKNTDVKGKVRKTVRSNTPYTIPRLPLELQGSWIGLHPLIGYTVQRPHCLQKGLGC